MMGRLQSFGQHAPRGFRGSIDAEQRCERYRQVDRFGMRPVNAWLKRETVESKRHMRIVRERRGVIGAFRASY
jgi:hypothetical protein